MAELLENPLCPICRKKVVQKDQIICTDCKASNPYNALGGYSPTFKIHEELTKIGGYKDEITRLGKRLKIYERVVIILLVTIAALAAVNIFF